MTAHAVEGLLAVDKPVGPTSHDIVSWVRRATGQKRAGHSGTLDPAASGLLLVALGRATRLIRYLPSSPKLYEGTIELGLRTETDDLEGEVIERRDGPLPGLEEVRRAARTFLGRSLQAPPRYSARKHGGERLYRLARSGKIVTVPPREIEVGSFEIRPGSAARRVDFLVSVSGGTYVRSLARDLGRRLGCGAALAALRRMAIGPLSVERAVPPPERGVRNWLPHGLVPLSALPLDLPTGRVENPEEIRRFRHGHPLPAREGESGPLRLLGPGDELLGVAECVDGERRPRVVLEPG